MKELYKFKVKDGENEVEFSFVEPSKSIMREGEIIYAKEYASCVRAGLLTNAEAQKLVNDRGGVFTDDEMQDFINKTQEFVDKNKLLFEKKEAGENVEALEKELDGVKRIVLAYQAKQEAIFDLTAETKAKNLVLIHYALALTYKDGKCFFEGKDFPTKLKNSDENLTPFKQEVLKYANWYSMSMYYGIKEATEPTFS